MIGEEKKVNDCGYPMCPAAKDASEELLRHKELRQDLGEIKINQNVMAKGLQEAVIKLEKIALLFSEIGHLRTDIDNLGEKHRTFEKEMRGEIKSIKEQRVTWLQQVIILLLGGGVMGIGGFLLAKLWPYITGGSG